MTATQAKPRGAPARATGGGFGLRLLAVMLGVFFIAMSVTKIAWLTDSSILLQRFQQWLPNAAPGVRWYLETVCIPGAPLFARLVPIGECCAGIALIAGFWTRMAAIASFLMVVNFQFAMNAFSSPEFLTDPACLPVLGGLLALAISGSRLPFSASR
jgi:uncharacterized membrane protein YphA (DoxX/SURF4 family)